MAKPLDERIAAVMGHGARASTVAEIITEIAAAIDAAQAEHDALDAKSKSIDVSEEDADAAADACAKLARRIDRLKAKREQLEQRHAELMNSERRKRLVSEHAAIKQRRDDLVQDLKDRWPLLVAEMVELLRRIEASDAEINAFQRGGAPSGLEWLGSAEAVARDCPGNWYRGSAPIQRFTQIRIPSFEGKGCAWPAHDREREIAAKIMEAESRQRREMKRAREAEEARWKRYSVAPHPKRSEAPRLECRHGLVEIVRNGEVIMTDEQVEAARAQGYTVEPLAPGQKVGLPTSGTIL